MNYAKNYKKIVRKSEKSKLEDKFTFLLKIENLPMPLRQYKFYPTRKWRCDFMYVQEKIAVEIEGGLFMKGQGKFTGAGHSHPIHIMRDIEKYNYLALMGYRLFRFGKKEINNGDAISMISRALENAKNNLFDYP